MKKGLVAALLVLSLVGGYQVANAGQDADNTEVYINLDEVWRQSNQGKQDLQKIETSINTSKEELNKIKDNMKQLKTDFDNASTEDAKKSIAQQMELKRRELIELTAQKNREIEGLKAKAQQEFIQTILPLVNTYRKENNIMVIHRYTPNNIISIDPEVDITEEIVEIYNNK